MINVLYISEQYLKDTTNLSQNIDTSILKPNMIKAQDIYISSFLGAELDTRLKTSISASTLTISETEVLSIIKKSLAEFVAYMSYVDVLYRWMNKAATAPNVENASAIDSKSLIYVRDIAKSNGEFYLDQVNTYLTTNKDLFPEYPANKCGENQTSAFKFAIEYGNDNNAINYKLNNPNKFNYIY